MVYQKKGKYSIHVLALITLSACTMAPSNDGKKQEPRHITKTQQKETIEGKWISQNQRSYSIFKEGKFATIAINTEEKIALGSYKTQNNRLIVEGVSLIRKTPITFTCEIIATKNLACISKTGEHLILKRLK